MKYDEYVVWALHERDKKDKVVKHRGTAARLLLLWLLPAFLFLWLVSWSIYWIATRKLEVKKK